MNVEFKGTATAPVKFVNLDGFRYNGSSRTFAKCSEQVLKSYWIIYRGGARFMSGVEDSAITNSFFDALGGNALFVSGYNPEAWGKTVDYNLFADAAAFSPRSAGHDGQAHQVGRSCGDRLSPAGKKAGPAAKLKKC